MDRYVWWVSHERLAQSRRSGYVRYVRKVAIVCEFYRAGDKLASR